MRKGSRRGYDGNDRRGQFVMKEVVIYFSEHLFYLPCQAGHGCDLLTHMRTPFYSIKLMLQRGERAVILLFTRSLWVKSCAWLALVGAYAWGLFLRDRESAACGLS